MKKALLIGLLIGGAAAWAGAGIGTSARETSAETRPVPADAGEFYGSASFGLQDLSYLRVSVCAVRGTESVKVVGSLNAYLLDERTSAIQRNHLLDLDMTQQSAPAAGQCVVFPDQRVGIPEGRLIYAASGLKLTDGGTLVYVTTLSDGGVVYDGGAFTILYRGWKVVR